MEHYKNDCEQNNICCKRVIHETCCHPGYFYDNYDNKDCVKDYDDKKCHCDKEFDKRCDDKKYVNYRCCCGRNFDKKQDNEFYCNRENKYDDNFCKEDNKCDDKHDYNNDWNDDKKCCCRRQNRCGGFCRMFRFW